MSDEKRKYPKLRAARTVGALIKQLQRLPPRMRIGLRSEDGVLPVVFNVDYPDVHVSLEENDGTWDDERETP
jgi:hypothetical protein